MLFWQRSTTTTTRYCRQISTSKTSQKRSFTYWMSTWLWWCQPGHLFSSDFWKITTSQLLKKVLDIINVHIPAAVNETINRVDKLMEEKGVRTGHATMGEIERMFTEKFERLERKLTNEFNLIDRTVLRTAATPRETVTTCNRMPCRKIGVTPWYQWKYPNGKWYGIPPNTQYPNPKTGLGPLISQFYHGRVVTSIEGDRSIMPIWWGLKMYPRTPKWTFKEGSTQLEHHVQDYQKPNDSSTTFKTRLSEAKQFVKFLRSNIEKNFDKEERGYSTPPCKTVTRWRNMFTLFLHTVHLGDSHQLRNNVRPATRKNGQLISITWEDGNVNLYSMVFLVKSLSIM